ncbi:MAG: hypothetical protein WD686_05390 [Candidatus Woykebacteria bacterium]
MLNLKIRMSAMALISVPVLVASPTIAKVPEEPKTTSQIEVTSSTENSPNVVFKDTITAKKDDRAKILAKFLKGRNSPMAKNATALVKIADKYSLDYRFLPAIAGLESQYGLMVPKGSYNPYGWNNGSAQFKNWADASDKVASGIRSRYAPKGEVTPYRIGSSYAASPTWAVRVASYMSQIN